MLPHRPAGFRRDIEGLRALAVLLVVLGHAGLASVTGGYVGVDVFFVISGFVITGALLREARDTGTVSLRRFYARRALRLIPAAVPVLLAVLVATWVLQPLRAVSTALDALAGAAYVVNIRLPYVGTDYFRHGEPPSPVQHFWSLAVEEQFYLLWPLLLLALLARNRGRVSLDGDRRPDFGGPDAGGVPVRRIAAAVALVAAASLAASVALTAAAPQWAYFSLPTRAWELAAGVLLALGADRLRRLPRPVAAAATPLGLAAIGVAAATFDESTAFPGYAALLPVLGTAAVLAGGTAAPDGPAGRLLGWAPVQYLGRLSYSWYLWHWPLLTFGAVALDAELTPGQGVALAAVALGVAAASHHLLENPVRHLPALRLVPARGLALGTGLSALTALTALLATQYVPDLGGRGQQVDARTAVASARSPQSRLSQLLTASGRPTVVPANLTPPLRAAADNLPAPYRDRCQERDDPAWQLAHCVYGDRGAATTVALIGDSHAAHWFDALDTVATQRRWRLSVWIRNECTPASVLVYGRSERRMLHDCSRWRAAALERIAALKPALVIAANTGTYSTAPGGGVDAHAGWVQGWRETVRRATATGARMAFINTTPHLRDDVLSCLVNHAADARACQRDRREAVPNVERRDVVTRTLRAAGVHVIDPLPWLCTATACPPVVANTLVYRDNNHLTTAYSALLAPVLGRALATVDLPTRRPATTRAAARR